MKEWVDAPMPFQDEAFSLIFLHLMGGTSSVIQEMEEYVSQGKGLQLLANLITIAGYAAIEGIAREAEEEMSQDDARERAIDLIRTVQQKMAWMDKERWG